MKRRVASTQPFRGLVFIVVLIVVVTGLSSPVFPQRTVAPSRVARELSETFSAAARTAMPAVVSIRIERVVMRATPGMGEAEEATSPLEDFLRRFYGDALPQQRAPQRRLQTGQGSGFIISRDGYILTNNHVVGNVDRMTVTLQDGRTFTDAEVIGTDPDTEVALIKIPGSNFPIVQFGDSDDLEVGDWVLAIGNPFGLASTVTAGIGSATERMVGIAAYENFIQTDAAINPGNSGGPLIDLNGRAVGINTAIFSETGGHMGIGFAIPIGMARQVADQLRRTGRVVRGYLGLYGADLTPEMAEILNLDPQGGVIVAQVEPGSPAAEAGLRRDDVILEVNDEPIQEYIPFRNAVAAMRPGTVLDLLIWRAGRTFERSVTLGERPTARAPAREPRRPEPAPDDTRHTLGVEVRALTQSLAQRFGYQMGEGVLVTSVTPGSPASTAGMQPGDLIVSVNAQTVTSTEQFGRLIRQARQAGRALLLVQRGPASQYVVVNSR